MEGKCYEKGQEYLERIVGEIAELRD